MLVKRIRRVTPEEYDLVGEITLAAYGPHLHDVEGDYPDQLRDTETRDREAEVWVAVADTSDSTELVLGSVTICPPGSPWREISRDGEGEFRMLGVAPTAQGQGVGQELVEFAVERFREAGATAVVLSSSTDMAAAHRTYEKLGFLRTPELDWSPLPAVPLITYRLAL